MQIEERFWSRYAFWVTTYAKPPLFFWFCDIMHTKCAKGTKI